MQQRQAAWRKRFEKLAPQIAFLEAIRAELPEDGLFVDEVTQVGFAARLALPVYKPRTFLSPGYQDNLGWVLPPPRRPACAAGRAGRGDLGRRRLHVHANELATAMPHRIPLVTVVFNDGAFAMEAHPAGRFGNRLIGSDLVNPDFVGFAESFGAKARGPGAAGTARGVAARLRASDGPTIIDVPVGAMPSPWESSIWAGFAANRSLRPAAGLATR